MQRRIFLFAVCSFWLMFSSAADANEIKLRAGVAKVNITPSLPAWLNGYASRQKPANGVLHDIWAKALVLEESPQRRVVIVTLDLLGLSHDIVLEISRRADSLYGISRSQLILNSSHTHSAPVIWPCLNVIYAFDVPDQQKVAAYSQKLITDVVKLIGSALDDLSPAQLFSGHGTADFAINRRNDIHPNGPVDHDVTVLKVQDNDGKTKALLFGYACHNTTLVDDNYLVNGDYAGFAQIDLEKKYPSAQAMFLQGCAGDQNPAPRGTVALAATHGQRLADAVEKVLSNSMRTVSAPMSTAYTSVDLPFRNFDLAAYRKDLTGSDVFLQRRAKIMLDAYNRGMTLDHMNYPVQVVRFNKDLTLLALADEVVVDYSLRAKKEFAGENLFVAAYCGEVMCYIPSLRVLREGGYEADENMIYYGFPGPFKESVEDSVFDAIRKVMRAAGARPSFRTSAAGIAKDKSNW